VNLIDRVREVLPEKYRELAKFLVVGGSSWILDTGIFTLLSHTVLYDKVITSKIISVLVSTIFNYILNREWSFKDRGGRERHHEAMLFFLVSAIALVVNLIPLWLTHYAFAINTAHHSQFTVSIVDFIAANIIGTLLAMAFRFWAYRRYVFPDELTADGGTSAAGGTITGGGTAARAGLDRPSSR
jgi:putative flippase GtrA